MMLLDFRDGLSSPGLPLLLLLAPLLVAGAFFVVAWRRREPGDTPFLACLRQVNRWHLRWLHGLGLPDTDPLPREGAGIVVANHRSGLDPTAIISQTARIIRFLIAREYYEVFFLKPVFRRLELIPVHRNGHDLAALKRSIRALREGEMVGLFPGGGIENPPPSVEESEEAAGDPDSLKYGAALLALRTGAPVYPVYIEGTPRLDSVFLAFLRPSRTRVHFGEPLRLAPSERRSPTREELREATRRIHRAIEQAAPPAREPHPV